METRKLNRRDFVTKSSIGIVGVCAGLISNEPINQNYYLKNIQEQTRIKEYRALGRTGFKVSDIGCGTISISNENVLKSILTAGVNFIDTADAYSNGNNEKMLEEPLKTSIGVLYLLTQKHLSWKVTPTIALYYGKTVTGKT